MADALQDIKDEKGVARIKSEYVFLDVDSHYMVKSLLCNTLLNVRKR